MKEQVKVKNRRKELRLKSLSEERKYTFKPKKVKKEN
jgi:hypothetical protein